MTMRLFRVTQPAEEPVTVAEAKIHCRVDHSEEDALIAMLIKAARLSCEHETGRTLVSCQWELVADKFTAPLAIAYDASAIVSVKFLDANGVQQTVAPEDYTLGASGLLWPVESWPDIGDKPDPVRVRYSAGYATAADVPASLKSWIFLHVAHFYKNRELATAGPMNALQFAAGLLDEARVWRDR